MKILEIILDNRLAGISQRALTVAEAIKKKGVVTSFLLPKEQGNVNIIAHERGIQVDQITMPRPNPRKLLRNLLWLFMLPVNTLQMCKIIRKNDIDIVHVNGLINLPGLFAAKLCRIPIIWHLAATDVYPRWLVYLFRIALKRATVVICIAERVKDYFLGKGCEKYSYRIIFEPVDNARFNDTEKRTQFQSIRNEFGINKDTFLITTVANISPRKGIIDAIEAMGSLAKTHKDIRYLVIGEILSSQSAYFTKLKETIELHGLQEKVTFAGRRSDVGNVLKETNAFLLPSLSEGTPISILEAMALKVPVVASNVGGIPEQIEDGVTGLLVDPQSAPQIVAAIDRIIQDTVFSSTATNNAYEVVHTRFSLTNFLDVFKNLLDELVVGETETE